MGLPRPSKKFVQVALFSLTLLAIYGMPKKVSQEVRSFCIDRVSLNEEKAPAIIYQESVRGGSRVWINVEAPLNSPVLYEGALIGLVDLSEKKKSRVLLLTDETLVTSVRVLRGEDQKRILLEKLETLITSFRLMGEDSRALEEEKLHLRTLVGKHYLAKGELQGVPLSFFHRGSCTLKGVGFNYDFSDEQGSARQLTTGIPYDHSDEGIPLIEEGDLLVTTGFDGVFPPDLPVALVSKVYPLEEGAPAYEIEAYLLAGNLQEIEKVTLMPPRM